MSFATFCTRCCNRLRRRFLSLSSARCMPGLIAGHNAAMRPCRAGVTVAVAASPWSKMIGRSFSCVAGMPQRLIAASATTVYITYAISPPNASRIVRRQ